MIKELDLIKYKKLLMKINKNYLKKANKVFRDKFTGPSQYFHEKCLHLAGNSRTFLSLEHIETIYAVLPAWGMHRMGPGQTKVPEFKEFKESILSCKNILLKLRKKRIISDGFGGTVGEDLKMVFKAINGSISGAKLVSNSKVLAHILPDLVPPIDREYTLWFFGRSSVPRELNAQGELFIELCSKMREIAEKVQAVDRKQKYVPKVVDNLIIYYGSN